MTGVRIEQIGSDGLEEFFGLHRRYLEAIEEAALDDAGMSRIAEGSADGRIRFYGARRTGELVGICSLATAFTTFSGGAEYGILEDVYVAEPHRGTGVLRPLVDHVCSIAAEEGCASIVVGAGTGDVPMYRSLGFDLALGTMLARILTSG